MGNILKESAITSKGFGQPSEEDKVRTIATRKGVDNVVLSEDEKKVFEGLKIEYSLSGRKYTGTSDILEKKVQQAPGLAILTIEGEERKVQSIGYSAERSINIVPIESHENSSEFDHIEFTGKKAKDIATVLASNGIKVEGVELLSSSIGGKRSV